MQILIVEDNQDELNMLGVLFTQEGHVVTLVQNGAAALAHVAQISPDVIVLDIGLPGMDGFRIATAIRALESTPRPLIIALTGYTSEADYSKGRAAGFDFHFPKTIRPTIILDVIRDHGGNVTSKLEP